MKTRILSLIFLMVLSFSNAVFADDDYIKTTMDNNRYEMVQLVYGANAYNVKFDKWTGNIWLYSKDGVSLAMRDPNNADNQGNQCVYQLMKGNRDSIEQCFVINTATGEVWEVSFKKGTVKYDKK